MNSHHDSAFRGRITVNGVGIDLLMNTAIQMGNHGNDHGYADLVEDFTPDSTHNFGYSKFFYFVPTAWSNNTIVTSGGGFGGAINAYPIDTNGIWTGFNFYSSPPLYTSAGNHAPEIPGVLSFQTTSNGIYIPIGRVLITSNAPIKLYGGVNSGIQYAVPGDSSTAPQWSVFEDNSKDYVIQEAATGKNRIELDNFQSDSYFNYTVNGRNLFYGSGNENFSKTIFWAGINTVTATKPTAVTVGASPFTFVNNTGVNLECWIDDGAALFSLSKNGVAVRSSLAGSSGMFVLQPTNSIVLTYPVTAPTFTTNQF